MKRILINGIVYTITDREFNIITDCKKETYLSNGQPDIEWVEKNEIFRELCDKIIRKYKGGRFIIVDFECNPFSWQEIIELRKKLKCKKL